MSYDRFDRRSMLKASALTGLAMAAPADAARTSRGTFARHLPFDAGWKFALGDVIGASSAEFDDRSWRSLDLPHDWSIEDRPGAPETTGKWQPPAALWNTAARPKNAKTFGPGLPIVIAQVPAADDNGPPLRVGPFDAEASGGGWTTGWAVGGVGWYRKTFAVSDLAASEQVELYFEGAYRETEVWLNGVHVGRNVNGYMGFAVDLTPHLRPNGLNALAVRVSNLGDNSRWYSGSGIYRHVWLNRTGELRSALWGVAVETREATPASASLVVSIDLENRAAQPVDATCKVVIRGPAGRVVASGEALLAVEAAGNARVEVPLKVPKPAMWEPERPVLYSAEVTIVRDGALSDRVTQRFGIRTLALSGEAGFRINGKPYKLKGACVHHDNGILGAVALDDAEHRKVRLMKEAGFNAIRCSHNPFSTAFLNACDELGMIVVDEAFDVWEKPKRADDYHRYFPDHWRDDLTAMVRRDRNHPSIAFWSIGNEITEINTARGAEIAGQLRARILEIDRTRFVTSALTMAHQGKSGAAARKHLDVSGYNYMYEAAVRDHVKEPSGVFMNTESYAKDIHAIWQDVERYSWLLGDFAWTGMDYLGEVGLGSSRLQPLPPPKTRNMLDIFLWDYPAFQANSGDLDILGRKKPQGSYRDVVWGRSAIEVFVQRPVPVGTYEDVSDWGWHDEIPSWTWVGHEDQPLTVRVYSPGDEVALLLNGREAARKRIVPGDRMRTELEVPYRAGELVAIAMANGREIGRKVLTTTGEAARVRLWAEEKKVDRTRGRLLHVFAEIVDSDGRRLADATVPIAFTVQGAGHLIAAGSAHPYAVESLRDGLCRSFRGTALAIVSMSGRRGGLQITASSPGIAAGTAKF